MKVCFKVWAVISDDHSENANDVLHLLKDCNGDKKHYIYHPAYGTLLKTFLFFDINSLLNCKKFVFPTFSFDKPENISDAPKGFIS